MNQSSSSEIIYQRRIVRLQRISLFLGVAFVLVIGVAATSNQDAVFDSITAKRFILMNHAGTKIRGIITTSDKGEPLLKFLADDGKTTLLQAIVDVTENPSIVLYNKKEQPQLVLEHTQATDIGPPFSSVRLSNLKLNEPSAMLAVVGGTPVLNLKSELDGTNCSLILFPVEKDQEQPNLTIKTGDGKTLFSTIGK